MKTIKIHDDAKTPTSELISQCKKKFPVWSYWNAAELDKNFPPPKEPTTREFENVREAHDFAGKCTADVDKEGVAKECCTLRERLLLELDYFKKTGEHLDREKITFCAGSRLPDGAVPGVRFNHGDGEVYVYAYAPQDAYDRVRFRRVVSLSSLPSNPSDLESRVKALEDWRERFAEVLAHIHDAK